MLAQNPDGDTITAHEFATARQDLTTLLENTGGYVPEQVAAINERVQSQRQRQRERIARQQRFAQASISTVAAATAATTPRTPHRHCHTPPRALASRCVRACGAWQFTHLPHTYDGFLFIFTHDGSEGVSTHDGLGRTALVRRFKHMLVSVGLHTHIDSGPCDSALNACKGGLILVSTDGVNDAPVRSVVKGFIPYLRFTD
jgi:hypothetical protein